MTEESLQRSFIPIQDEVRRMFKEMIYDTWGRSGSAETTSQWQPSVDMCETEEAIIVEVELPGVRRDDIRVEVEGDLLRIVGERRTTTQRQGRNYLRLEQHYGRFERQLRLPRTVDREAIQADFDAGVLTLTLPKTAEA